jgi:hypothetical protein
MLTATNQPRELWAESSNCVFFKGIELLEKLSPTKHHMKHGLEENPIFLI